MCRREMQRMRRKIPVAHLPCAEPDLYQFNSMVQRKISQTPEPCLKKPQQLRKRMYLTVLHPALSASRLLDYSLVTRAECTGAIRRFGAPGTGESGVPWHPVPEKR